MPGKTLVCTGGGTAGHVLPVEPLIRYFDDSGWKVHFIGSTSGLETRLLNGVPATCHEITCGKLRRYFSFQNLVDALRVPVGIIQAWWKLGRIRPNLVFSKGGYVSFPVVVAAWLRRVPVIVHESDHSAGLANRMAFPFARLVCTNFENTPVSASKQVRWTGLPLRDSLLEGDAEAGRSLSGAPEDKPLVVVVGGSLGSASLNQAVRDALPELVQLAYVAHICGEGLVDPAFNQVQGYRQFPFVGESWGDLLAAADLVVSRAGATMLAELLALHIPSLLVPLPRQASRGEQIDNAAYARSQGYARVLREEDLTATEFAAEVREMLENRDYWKSQLASYRAPDALERISGLIRQFAK